MNKRGNAWNRFSKEYDKAVGDKGNVYHSIYTVPVLLKLLGNLKGKKVLDLACGQGYFSELMEKMGAKVVGVDYSSELIKIASNRGLKTKFHVGSSSDMKFLKNKSFDIVLCNFALHDIKDLPGTMKEVSRVLKKGGKFIWVISHPAFKTAYVKNGIENGKYFKKIYGYMKEKTCSNEISSDIEYYHRPIGRYLEEMFKNGFVVSNFIEIATRHGGDEGKYIRDKVKREFKLAFPSFLAVEGIKIK